MPNKVLETKNLNAYYGDFQALFEVSIDLFEGEIIAIIGANGAGKSTFMRSVTGLIDRIDNEINYKGLSIKGLRADEIAKKGLAMVPEGRKLFPSLSVEENLLIGGQIKRLGPWELNTVYELFPDLYDKRNIPSNLLSGGQQQMAAIGRALMSNPDVILFDEISLGLAPIIIKSIYQNLPKVIQKGMSAIIVEQDISKALEISDRVYCLQEGRIALFGVQKNLPDKKLVKLTLEYNLWIGLIQ